MASTEQANGNDTTSSLIEHLGKAILDLEACKTTSVEKLQWVEIEEHFRNVEKILEKKSKELEEKEKEYEKQKAETQELLVEREVAIFAKEQDLLDRVQELKDAAVAAIEEARAYYQPTLSEPLDGRDCKTSKVSCSLDDTNCAEDLPHKTSESNEGVAADIKPRPDLVRFCEQMDAKGLLTFIMENNKNLNTMREELSVALESATEPARLVLDSLEGFYPLNETAPLVYKDAALQGMHKSCVTIMEAMAALMARIEPGTGHHLNPEIKQQAKVIADEWGLKLSSVATDAANGNTLEVEAFLQLLATFRIASEFDEEELCKLGLLVARRRQAPELCRSLGLTHKMPDFVQSLINSEKQIDAVHFIHAFELGQNFPSVPLLKTYLKDCRRNSQGGKAAKPVASGQIDVNAQELAALKTVIRCVEKYKLEADYPLDPLHKRVAQLEKSKSDRKRSGDTGKYQHPKRSRASGGFRDFRAPSGGAGRQGPHLYGEMAPYAAGVPERYHHAAPNPYDFQVPGQVTYTQSANDQRLYYYPHEEIVPAASYVAPSDYENHIVSGLQQYAAPSDYENHIVSGLQASHQLSGLQASHQPYI